MPANDPIEPQSISFNPPGNVMYQQALLRVMLTVLPAIILLGAWFWIAPDVPISQSRPLAVDYTRGGPCGATIQDCLNNSLLQSGDRLIIPAGNYTESLTLDKGVSLLGSGADHTIIHAVNRQRVLTITGSLITETTVISGLTFMGGHAEGSQFPHLCPVNCGGGILITDSARPLIMNSAMISNFAFNAGGGIAIQSDRPVTLINVRWISNTWGVGAGLYVEGQARIVHGQFSQNRWGAICVYGSLIMSDTVVVDNLGGGLYVSGTATIVGGRFENNSSATGGGIQALGTLNITGTQFISNSATSFDPGSGGGGVYIFGTASIADARFERNYSHYYGGGLRGGVVYLDDTIQVSTIQLRNTNFISNTAGFFGGGVAVGGNLSVTGGKFAHNHSGDIVGDGGGLHVYGSLDVHQTQFIDNTTAGRGGAIGQTDRVLSPASNAQIVNALFARNRATASGAALFSQASGSTLILHSTFVDTDQNPLAAIALVTGTVGITNSLIASHTIAISQTGDALVYEDYNLFFANALTQTGALNHGGHSHAGGPHFANPGIGNYHILSPSAAIDVGINADVFSDLDALPRPLGAGFDIGAYEYPDFPNRCYLPIIVSTH